MLGQKLVSPKKNVDKTSFKQKYLIDQIFGHKNIFFIDFLTKHFFGLKGMWISVIAKPSGLSFFSKTLKHSDFFILWEECMLL